MISGCVLLFILFDILLFLLYVVYKWGGGGGDL